MGLREDFMSKPSARTCFTYCDMALLFFALQDVQNRFVDMVVVLGQLTFTDVDATRAVNPTPRKTDSDHRGTDVYRNPHNARAYL